MKYSSLYIRDILENPRVQEARKNIISHELFHNLKSQKHMRIYMEHHIFQVWDFMILLKSVQFGINSFYKQGDDNFSCWFPKVPGKFSRLITEICLDEESDEELQNMSHFEYYMKGMEQSDADMYHIEKTLNYVRMKSEKEQDLSKLDSFPSESVREHFMYMREISNIVRDPDNLLFKPLASFCVGREDLIPDFFTAIVEQINDRSQINNNFFVKYLTRHIELDGDEHGEKGYELLAYFLEDDNFAEALEIVIKSLELRAKVLDTINEKVLAC